MIFGLTLSGASVSAQEFGGDLGGSSSVFRPKNPAPNAAQKPKTAGNSREIKRAENLRRIAPPVEKKSKNYAAAAKPVNSARRIAPRTAFSASRAVNKTEIYENAIAEGNDARDERRYTAAENAYRRALKTNANDARAAYGLGNLFVDQQIWSDAEKYYRQAIALDSKNSDARIALSYVLIQPNGSGNLSEKFVEAEQAARTAIALDPTNALAYDQLGVALESRGIISEETENAYKRAIGLDKTYAVAYAHYGRLMRKKGNQKAADAAFQQAHKLATDVPSMILFAEILQSEQRLGESEKLLRSALAQDAENPSALILFGRVLTLTGAENEAEQVLTKSIRVSPRSFAPYSMLGGILLRKGDLTRAEQIFLKGAGIASPNEKRQIAGIFGLIGVGDAYLKAERRADALRIYRKAAQIDPKNPLISARLAAFEKTNN